MSNTDKAKISFDFFRNHKTGEITMLTFTAGSYYCRMCGKPIVINRPLAGGKCYHCGQPLTNDVELMAAIQSIEETRKK